MYVRELFRSARTRRRARAAPADPPRTLPDRPGRPVRTLAAVPVLLALVLGCASGDDGGDRHTVGNSSGPGHKDADAAAPTTDPSLWIDPDSPYSLSSVPTWLPCAASVSSRRVVVRSISPWSFVVAAIQ
jgi:hypothetical protein